MSSISIVAPKTRDETNACSKLSFSAPIFLPNFQCTSAHQDDAGRRGVREEAVDDLLRRKNEEKEPDGVEIDFKKKRGKKGRRWSRFPVSSRA